MCIFSRRVEDVSGTRIFVRVADGVERLAYQMRFAALGETAMVLPLPVVPGSGEDAVKFIDMSEVRQFFAFLKNLFPMVPPPSAFAPQARPAAKQLVVHDVGDFDASYVPARADFDRLDPRFRLDDEVWSALPQYADWGFAVFALKPQAGTRRDVHPMAFSFPTRWPDQRFFPTVHVHDGVVHDTARFDHELYCQGAPPPEWEASQHVPQAWSFHIPHALGLVELDVPVYRRELRGEHTNRDLAV
jgi:hypothetical protein